MAEENKKHFILNKSFQNIKSILSQKKSIKDILNDAIFVLDTNSLLAPYQTGKEDIEEIRKIYSKLIADNRLFIPEHALKEFAKNRSVKISELFSNIDSFISTIPSVKSFQYPILGDLNAYKALNDAREDVTKAIKKYTECLKDLKSGIVDWNWSDPVTLMYSKTFSEALIVKSSATEEDLLKEYNFRLEFEIPPGNNDKSKDSNAIGDFVIWKTITELGISKTKDVVFITNDEKNDWLLKGNKKSISTKYELVHEFYELTGGCNFICMTFSTFLENLGVEITLVEDIDFTDFFNLLNNPSDEANESNKLATGTLESLNLVYSAIVSFLEQLDTSDESPYIIDEISEPINRFNSSYHNEFFESPYWQILFPYFFRFSEWLPLINRFNNEIIYQEQRMKRSTEAARIQMIALSKEFVIHYKELKKITPPNIAYT